MIPNVVRHNWLAAGSPLFWTASVCTMGGIATVTVIPSEFWSPAGLISLGLLSAFTGCIFLMRRTEPLVHAVKQTLGAFLVVYGACAAGGGLAGHDTPTEPLRSSQLAVQEPESLWKLARSEEEGQGLLAAAVAAGQKSLIIWADPGCTTCPSVRDLTVLNPTINPRLSGYRLIRIETLSGDTHSLREQFGVHDTPSLTLMLGNGSVPAYGRIQSKINAQTVMDILDVQEQAEEAAR